MDRVHSEADGLSVPAGEGGKTESQRHTPGPWAWGAGFTPGDSNGDLFGLGGRQVFACASYENMWFSTYDRDTDAANALLIAAAPELLEALEELTAVLGADSLDRDAVVPSYRKARAAIAKALGTEA